ncbi:MAG: aminoacyl-tRNA hydrolase [Robiginitomaculum sp.]|nr:MAG: aminoacyl-tRNA hydrolase [Robiginitomaculum sp.]
MLLIVGLGNPGAKYANNRHNIGFMAVDALADAHGFSAPKSKFSGSVREGFIETEGGRVKALILKPMTFMNESGRSVGAAAQFYKIPKDKIVVFHDELDLDAGKFRMKLGGGIAGHNGLRSIKAQMGAEFYRARIGIGHPGRKEQVHSHVLSDFAKSDRDWVDALLDACARASDLLAAGEIEKYQTKVNHLAPSPTSKPRRN